ncbi:SurA N-terminal domain-containing protein [Marinospirillum perlucidum]|uniref:SurA N-terminal domain-containing protein n=1 Tax=Marinospirillum perlucidum TaxID=1982602 RepID=UPI000DF4A33A|nr:SurA N-terminal domain-containing protein [Marinospirillum perlucidum]
MLLKIREKSKGIIAYFIVGLIALAFSLWGMDSLFTALRGDPNEVATVNGESISQVQVDRYAQQQMNRLLQSGQFSPEQLDMNQMRQLALTQLLQEELLRQEAQDLSLRIPERQLEREMVAFDAFHNEQGRFDRELFIERLERQGMTPADFRASLREDLLNQQLLQGLSATEFVLDGEVEEFQRLAGQQRDYRYRVLHPDALESQVDVSEEEVSAYYEAHQDEFMSPEQVQVDYLLFDPASLKSTIEITQAQLEEEYRRFAEDQEGRASAGHILLTFENEDEKQQAIETLTDARQSIQEGADFGELARELSDDSGSARQGGELGIIEAGSLDPAFEEALFALEEVGDVSEIVETDYGLHLIQLQGREEVDVPEFEAVEDDLRERLMDQPLRAATSDKLEELSNLSFSSDTLEEVAEAADLPMQTSDWLAKGQLDGFWAQQQVKEALFSAEIIEDGWITEPLRLDDGRYLLLAKEAHQPRQVRSLDVVADEVREALVFAQAQALAQEEAESIQTQLQAGQEVDVDWTLIEGANRNSRSANPLINRTAFRLNLDEEPATRVVTLPTGAVAVVELLAIDAGEISENQEEIERLRELMSNDRGARLQSQFVQQLQEEAEIEYRDR